MMLVFTPLINDLIPVIHTAVVVSEVSFLLKTIKPFMHSIINGRWCSLFYLGSIISALIEQ